MSPGQRAYEEDVRARPVYHDGTARRTWAQLSDLARWSWNKNPYPLPCAPIDAGSN
jgi:hypothetical protein